MAMKAKAAEPEKTDEKEKGKAPDFTVRIRQAPGSDFYITAGAAWLTTINGKECVSVKLNSVPVAWDGSALLMPPKE